MRITIHEYMKKKHLNQTKMAKMFGLTQPAINTYLNSDREVYVVDSISSGLQIVEKKVLATRVTK